MKDELSIYFDGINKSIEYQNYIKARDNLNQNKDVLKMINDINILKKKLCQIDYTDTINYVDTKEEIDGIIEVLNSIYEYREYTRARDSLYSSIYESKKLIEEYIDSIV